MVNPSAIVICVAVFLLVSLPVVQSFALNKHEPTAFALFGPVRRTTSARTRDIIRGLIIWIGTGVLASLLPLGLMSYVRDRAGLPNDLPAMLRTGELILISIILLLGTYGEFVLAIWDGRKVNGLDITVLISVPIACIIAGFLYGANVSINPSSGSGWTDPDGTLRTSVGTFLLSLIIGWGNIWRKSQRDPS
ncbi:hypothetical protein ABQE57_23185 [Mycolicibacterium elephantis]